MAMVTTTAIVDGYSTGNFLPPAFRALGVEVVHVQSTPQPLPAMAPPDLSAYAASVVCTGVDDAAGMAALAAHRPGAVVAGSEVAVPLVDALAERFGLPGNGTGGSTARRDKFRMIEAVRAAGLRCARQATATDPGAAASWADRAGYPVVVKPLDSASTQNVVVCNGPDRVRAAAAEILGATTMFGKQNQAVLVQTYLPGTEYIVDTVSRDGRRFVCGVWEYEKSTSGAGRPLYDRDVLMDPDAAPVPELVAYVDAALDALGIRHGPAHAEVIMTPDGPALVEVGARLNGNMNPDFHDRCMDANQAGLTALACARPDEFLARYGGRVYRRKQSAVVHNTQTTLDGVVESIDQAAVDAIAALPTVCDVVVRVAPGARLRPTTDLLTSPLRVFMVGDDDALRADHKVIGDLKDLVYRLARP
ncbi:ATP-grasp domain-containing protein [Actinokineospora sp. NPDC004072]